MGMGLGLACGSCGRPAVEARPLSLSWSCFYSHSFGPGFWEEAWETLLRSLAAGEAAVKERENTVWIHSWGPRRRPSVRYLLAYLGMSKVHSLYV